MDASRQPGYRGIMARAKKTDWTESRTVLQNEANETLIIRPTDVADAPWEFPGGRIEPRESPETGLRRLCRDRLGIELEFVLGQPPFEYNFGTHTVTYRYYFCRLGRGRVRASGGTETRWVRTGQLREYLFDAPTSQVVEWLLANPA